MTQGGADEFCVVYPFVPYQFKLIRATFDGIRKHGSSGKHTSGRERSLLSGFQESAQAVMDRDEQALVPYWRFYDSLNIQLEGYIRGVVIRAQEAAEAGGQGLEPQDVPVLKTLFLLKYVDGDMQATVNNVAILMAERIDEDKVARRAQVQESLDRLVRQNYVARYGDAYVFLTDDEQDVAREIAAVDVDTADVVRAIAQSLYGDVYREVKVQAGKRAFGLERLADEMLFSGRGGELALRAVTDAYPLDASVEQLLLRSADGGGELIVRLGDEDYFDDFRQAARIERYRQTKNVSAQPKPIRDIIAQYGDERVKLVERGREKLAAAVMGGRFFAAGTEVAAKGTTPAARIDAALAELVQKRFPKFGLITTFYDSDDEIQRIFTREDSLDGQVPNQPAVDAVDEWLGIKDQQHVKVSMAEVQSQFGGGAYGWREADIAACAAELIRAGKADVFRAGAQQEWRGNAQLVGWLRKRSETEKTEIRRRMAIDPALLNRARSVYKDFADVSAVSDDEDGLARDVAAVLEEQRDAWKGLLAREYGRGRDYPGREALEAGVRVTGQVLGAGTSKAELIRAFADAEDDLLDAAEDAAEVTSFFGSSQRKTFDEARRALAAVRRDGAAVKRDADAARAWARVEEILADARPYSKIQQLPQLVQTVKQVHAALLQRAQQEMGARAAEAFDAVAAKAAEEGVADQVSGGIARQREALAAKIATCDLIADVTVLGVEVDAESSRAYLAVTEAVHHREAVERARKRAAERTQAGDAEPAVRVNPAPAPVAERTLSVSRVSRAVVLPPEVLTTPAEVDAYVERLRRALMQGLADHDAVQLR